MIVLNHIQTRDLIKGGQAFGHGKAYANGSIPLASIPLGSAHASTDTSTFTIHSKESTNKQTAATNDNTSAVSKAADAVKSNTDTTKKTNNALTKFQKALSNLKDWIEVRLNYRDWQIEYSEATSENKNTYKKKNITDDKDKLNAISAAEDWNTTKISELKKAVDEYNKEITKVRNLAVSKKLVGGKRADALLEKALTGSVDKTLEYDIESMKGLVNSDGTKIGSQISTGKKKKGSSKSETYTSKELVYVEALEEWIGKMRDAKKAIQEAKQKAKELAQTRLDNITSQFEGLVSYAESLQNLSDSYINLLTRRGQTAVNDTKFKVEYDAQMEQQNFTTGYLKAERNAYKDELNHALSVFGADSDEYHAALTEFNNIQQAIYDSEAKYYELRKAKAELEFTAIQQVAERIKSVTGLIGSRISFLQAIDNENVRTGSTGIGEDGLNAYQTLYNKTIDSNNNLIMQWKKQWDTAVKDMGEFQLTDDNAEEYQEYYKRVIEAETEINNLLANQQEIKKNIRDLRWKSFVNLQQTIENTISDFDTLRETMRNAEFFDEEYGIEITDKGYANIELLAQSMVKAKQQIKDYRKALEVLDEEYKNGNITLTDFEETSRQYVETIQSSAKAVAGYEDELVNMYTSMIQAENDLLQKNISARKEALQAKKSYYDYDKQLSQKNKDMAGLMAQINALEGVTNQAGQAKLTQLRAQLKDAQDDMDDTLYQHEIEVRQQGFDQLAEDATEILNDTLRLIDANQEERMKIVQYQLDLLNDHEAQASDAINGILTDTGIVLDSTAQAQLDGFNANLTDEQKGLPGVNDKLTTVVSLISAATDTSWADDISSAISNIDTTRIYQGSEDAINSVKQAENAIMTDINGLKTQQAENSTKLTSIENALQDQNNKDANAESEALKESQENKGQTSGDQNMIAATSAGGSINDQVKDTPGLKTEQELAQEAQMQYQIAKQTSQYNLTNQRNIIENLVNQARDLTIALAKAKASGANQKTVNGYQTKLNNTNVKLAQERNKYEQLQSGYIGSYGQDNISNAAISYNTDPIMDIINSGENHGAITKDEKNKKHELWQHIVKKYRKEPTYKIYKELAAQLGVKMSDSPTNTEKDKLLKALIAAGYSKGAKSTDDELNWLHDSEVVIRKSDGAILQPFNAGDMVFTSKQSENLWKMSQIPLDKIKEMVANPDMSKFIQPGITDKVSTTENNNQQIHFDSLITINGNADHDTVMDLQQIASALINNRDFKKNLSNYVTKDLTREAAKSGFRGR